MSEDRKKVLTKLKTLINTFESLYKVKADKLGLYLLALMYHLPYEVSYKILDKYGFLEKEELFEEFYNIKDELKKLPERDSELYRKLKGLNKNTIIFLSAYLDDTFTERVIKIFSKELDKKNILSGHDLKELGFKPSEEMGKILNDVYNKFIDNEIKTKSEAIDYVKKKYKKEEIKN
jgi:tRNA nucleotidyltransferase (CCA-adding enzyme)